MQVIFWGTRGSIATPGPDTVRYGGNTACVSVHLERGPLLILDAGTGIRALGKALVASGVKDMILCLSHAHWDHIQGFPFFAPAYLHECRIRVLGCPTGTKRLRQILSDQMERTYFPVPLAALAADLQFEEFCTDCELIGSARIQAFPIHHPGGGRGFRIDEGARSVVYLTDNELPGRGVEWDMYVRMCQDADLLIHDAQFTDLELAAHVGWGHSSCTQATRLALDAGVRRLALFHHDPNRSDEQLDVIVQACRSLAEAEGSPLCIAAAAEGMAQTI